MRPREAVLRSPAFKALWDRIQHKTTYRVHYDNERLVADCTRALRDAPPIPKTRLQWRKADIAIGKAGVEATERDGAQTVVLGMVRTSVLNRLESPKSGTGLFEKMVFIFIF